MSKALAQISIFVFDAIWKVLFNQIFSPCYRLDYFILCGC